MNKLEEAAKAHWESRYPVGERWEDLDAETIADMMTDMRAALAVLREPSEAMERDGRNADLCFTQGNWLKVYQAMIDAVEGD